MKPRRIPSCMLVAAVAACRIGGGANASTSFHDGGDGGGGPGSDADVERTRTKKKKTTTRPPPPPRSLQAQDRDYWWHDNRSDEKDIRIVYHPIGPQQENDGVMELNSGNAAADDVDVDVDASGRAGFSVYSVAVSNGPDTSELPHQQQEQQQQQQQQQQEPPREDRPPPPSDWEDGTTPAPSPLETPWPTWSVEAEEDADETDMIESSWQLAENSDNDYYDYSTPSPVPLRNYHAAVNPDPLAAHSVLYSESFQDGYIHLDVPGFFSWTESGNERWEVVVEQEDDVDRESPRHVAAIGGSGRFASEGKLLLTVGGGHDGTPLDGRASEEITTGGAYVSFDVRADVNFPTDSLVFKVDGEIVGYWVAPTTEGRERVEVHFPPGDDMHELEWTYGYYGEKGGGGDGDGDDSSSAVQLGDLVVRAITGDLAVDGEVLREIERGEGRNAHALNPRDPSGEGGWDVGSDVLDDDGLVVLVADTKEVIRAVNGGGELRTYHGAAVASLALVAGEFGGTLSFAIEADVHAPLDVLEVGLDGEAIVAVTGRTDGWEEHSLELEPGSHVATFVHVSNPANMPIETLENMGYPGYSRVGGLRYRDHVDPRLLTPVPSHEPTRGPSAAPTPFHIPPQNYCGETLASVREACYTEDAVTCNDGDDACPGLAFCWGNVECDIPMWFMEQLRATPSPTTSPTATPVVTQNYCGANLASIRARCASGTLDTCNDDDGPCPSGTFCWGNIECEVAPEEDAPAAPSPQNYCGTSLASIKASCASGALPTCNDDSEKCPEGTYCWGDVECDPIETNAPTASPAVQTIESFLDSFFSTGTAGGDDDDSEEQATEEIEEAATAQTGSQAAAAATGDCPEGTSPVPDLPECCVADPSFLGDGACDAHPPYNTAACGYDLGDCCRESCDPSSSFACAAKEGDAYGPFGYYCVDPAHGAPVDAEACAADNREWVGDGGCDPEYNTQGCGWDGGDCCRETCDPAFAYYECGREAQPFDCKNPDIIYRAGYVP